MTHGNGLGSQRERIVRQEVDHLLTNSPSYRQLDDGSRRELADAISKIASYMSSTPANGALAGQLAPAPGIPQVPGAPGTQPGQPQPPKPAAPSGGQASATGRVGEVARATLSAIDFPGFVAALIQGTFQAIVDASIQQMEAYATLLKNVAGTVDRFMTDNISDGMARDYLAEQYPGQIARDTSSGQPKLTVNRKKKQNEAIPSFFKDLGFDTADDIDDDAIETVLVPATRRFLAESRQRTLATMVLMGINRVVVDDGEIMAKLQFHIDASETMNLRFDETKTTAGNMTGYAGRSPFTAQAVMVNTTSLNAQSDLNVRADLTGQVRVKFRSETFPLERFADSAAIQLINSNARVPQPQGATPAPVAGQQPAAAPPPPSPAAARPPAPVSQGLEAPADPWAPEA